MIIVLINEISFVNLIKAISKLYPTYQKQEKSNLVLYLKFYLCIQ